jgi:site-specific recombinase XerD
MSSMNAPVIVDQFEIIAAHERDLAPGTQRRIAAGVADNTRRAYSRIGHEFVAWCESQRRIAVPATGETLADYISALADAGKGPASLEQAIAAVRTLHRTAGYKGDPDTDRARLVVRSHRRERADTGARTKQAPPVTIDALRSMVVTTGDDTAGLRDRLVLVLGLALMARRSELAALQLGDVQETADGLLVLIRKSKTDQDARGVEVAIPPGQHASTDPVRLVRAWRALLAERGIESGPLLRTVNRHGHLGGAMSDAAINGVVQRLAQRAGLPDAERYSAHSLRAGGATVAYRNGAGVSAIAQHGRWAPNSPVVLSYIRSVDRWRDNPMAGIGL